MAAVKSPALPSLPRSQQQEQTSSGAANGTATRTGHTVTPITQYAATTAPLMGTPTFEGLGVFAPLATASQITADMLEIRIPAPASSKASATYYRSGELRLALIPGGDDTTVTARVVLPANTLPTAVSAEWQRSGPFCMWNVRVQLSTHMPVIVDISAAPQQQ